MSLPGQNDHPKTFIVGHCVKNCQRIEIMRRAMEFSSKAFPAGKKVLKN